MAWQYIPAQLQQVERDYNDSRYTQATFPPGYYLGTKADEGKLLLQTTSARSANSPIYSANGWLICEKPWLEFSVSGLSSAGELVWSGTFAPFGWNADSSTTQDIATDECAVYCGKPVFSDGGRFLHYSPTEGKYILRVQAQGILHEPCYSLNMLSGGTSGEYFFKSNLDSLTVDSSWDSWQRQAEAFTLSLAGATDEAKDVDYINGYTAKAEVKLDGYWTYKGNPETSAFDEAPAGIYENKATSATWEVGTKTYLSTDGEGKREVWKGRRLKSRYAQFVSESYGILASAANTDAFGRCWWTGGRTATYVFQTGEDATLPDSFTLARYEKNDEDEWEPVPSGNLEMSLGPYVLDKTENEIKMGEFTLWR